jgi:hypothetical protein
MLQTRTENMRDLPKTAWLKAYAYCENGPRTVPMREESGLQAV